MNYLATYLAHHLHKKIFLLSGEEIEKDIKDIFNDTNVEFIYLFEYEGDVIKNTKSVDDINSTDASILVIHNFLPNLDLLYELLAKCHFENVLLYYDEDKLDYFKAWESLRDNTKHITIILQKEERKRDILIWDKDKNSDIELSVIFPVYNVEKYIKQCIDTVTAWKAPYVEYIFVSDGSKDGSADIIKEATKKDKRIILLEKDNGGCASARQAGLDIAKGRYVGFIDPDDFVDESMYEKLLKRALLGSLDITVCGYNEYYNNTGKSKPVPDMIGFPYTWGLYTRADIDPFIAYLRIGIWRGIYRREMLIENNIHFYLDLPRYDDLPFKVETLAVAEKIATVDEHLYYYRLDREGQDVGANDQKLYVHFDIFKHLDKFFENRSDNQKYYYSIVKRDTHNWALSKIKKELKPEYKKLMKEEN